MIEGYPLIKLMCCLTKLPNISSTDFRRHWQESHRQLAVELVKKTGAQSFRQNTTLQLAINEHLQKLTHADSPSFDGVAEVVWDEAMAPKKLFEDPTFINELKLLVESLEKVADLSKSTLFFTETESLISQNEQ